MGPHALRYSGGELFAAAFDGAVYDAFIVDGIGESLTEDFVGCRSLLVIHVSHAAQERRIFINVDVLVRFQLIDLIHRDALGDVQVPFLQLQTLCGRILDNVEHHMLDGRRFAGVILLCIQLDGLTRGVRGDFISTGAHGVGSQVRGAHIVVLRLVHDLRVHDARRIDGEGVEEGRKWFLQLEDDRGVVRGLDGLYHFEIIGRAFLHILHAFDGELDSRCVDRAAVSELVSFGQLEGPGEAVLADGPGFRKRRLYFGGRFAVYGFIFHKAFVSRIGDGPAGIIHGDSRVQGFRILRKAHHHGILRNAAGCCLLTAATAAACQRNQSQTGHSSQYHMTHHFLHSVHSPLEMEGNRNFSHTKSRREKITAAPLPPNSKSHPKERWLRCLK